MRFLVGLILIVFLSPLTVWWAESQHRADDFSTAKQVEAASGEEGYIVTSGPASAITPVFCPTATEEEQAADCVYVKTTEKEYVYSEKVECGEIGSDKRIIMQVEDRCDDEGCEPCYRVEHYEWETIDTFEDYAEIKIGGYTVKPSGSTNFIGSDELKEYLGVEVNGRLSNKSNPEIGDIEFTYNFLPVSETMLVAGNATNNAIAGAGEKIFVISELDYESTLAALESQDKNTGMGLRILSLILMIAGFIALSSPLASLFSGVTSVIPFMGKAIGKSVSGALAAISAVIGLAVWLVMWGVVLLIKNIFVIIGLLLVVGVVIGLAVWQKQKLSSGIKKPDNPELQEKPEDQIQSSEPPQEPPQTPQG